ncbi:hypothetical protein DL95DRAFT_380789 [Leptodontidium sp. 2 PMI_412]|nr:hypothetical protein DL95DRAFT_380789 [Leptodontidium sp. 2 PMI_412]
MLRSFRAKLLGCQRLGARLREPRHATPRSYISCFFSSFMIVPGFLGLDSSLVNPTDMAAPGFMEGQKGE